MFYMIGRVKINKLRRKKNSILPSFKKNIFEKPLEVIHFPEKYESNQQWQQLKKLK